MAFLIVNLKSMRQKMEIEFIKNSVVSGSVNYIKTIHVTRNVTSISSLVLSTMGLEGLEGIFHRV